MEFAEALEEYLVTIDVSRSADIRVKRLIKTALASGYEEQKLIEPLENYLKKKPSSIVCAKILADYYFDRGRVKEAVSVYLPALIAVKNTKAILEYGVRLKEKHPLEALRVFEAFAEAFPEDTTHSIVLFEAAALRLRSVTARGRWHCTSVSPKKIPIPEKAKPHA